MSRRSSWRQERVEDFSGLENLSVVGVDRTRQQLPNASGRVDPPVSLARKRQPVPRQGASTIAEAHVNAT